MGVIARVVFGGEFRSASFGVTFEGEFLWAGGIESSTKLDPRERDMVSVLVLDADLTYVPCCCVWMSGSTGLGYIAHFDLQ